MILRTLLLVSIICFGRSQETSKYGALLKVTNPKSLVDDLDRLTGNEGGRVEGRPALFGSPPYNNRLKGRLVYPTDQGNPTGCDPFTPEMLPDWMKERGNEGSPDYLFPPIFIMDRGNCYFKDKVKHAQDAGAVAAIVTDSRNEIGLPFMAGNDPTVRIPSMLIHREHGVLFENFLKAPANNATAVRIEMLWSLPRPDNRVEWDMWALSFEPTLVEFKNVMRQINAALGEHALFTMHYHVIPGHSFDCDRPGLPCGNQCTNQGRYCEEDPDKDQDQGFSGRDVVVENLRQKCVWVWDNSTSTPATHARKFFEYLDVFDQECLLKKDFTERCSQNVQRHVGGQDLVDSVAACVAARDPESDSSVDFWEEDMIWRARLGVLPSISTIVINEVPYRGSLLKCLPPVNVQTCPVMATICAGFLPGTEPDACLGSSVCELGEELDACNICGGDGSTCAEPAVGKPGRGDPSASDPGLSGGVIALIVTASILLALGSAAGCFVVLKKQRDSERRLDDFMASYRPLDNSDATDKGGLMTGQTSSTADL